MVGLSSGNRWCCRLPKLLGKGHVRASDVVVHDVKADRVNVVFNFLAESVG